MKDFLIMWFFISVGMALIVGYVALALHIGGWVGISMALLGFSSLVAYLIT